MFRGISYSIVKICITLEQCYTTVILILLRQSVVYHNDFIIVVLFTHFNCRSVSSINQAWSLFSRSGLRRL